MPGAAVSVSMSVVTVRKLTAEDWRALRQARLAALAEAPYAFGSTLAREQAFDAERWRDRAGQGRTFGAFDGPDLVGLATGFPEDGQPAPADGQPRWQLVGMWVAPAIRGRGIADQLVDAVCAMAREAGAELVTLWVTEVNDRARAFYRRHGFASTGARQPVRQDEPGNWEEELARPLS
jgi:ribosomal protein S18 acetylase RimI-like enzyme